MYFIQVGHFAKYEKKSKSRDLTLKEKQALYKILYKETGLDKYLDKRKYILPYI